MRPSRTYDTAAKRWAGIGPYFAMFPTSFADRVVKTHTNPGDVVIDPFAGRGTTIFSAASNNRMGVGIELNPVGWVYAKSKLNPGNRSLVERRARALGEFSSFYERTDVCGSRFFRNCFTLKVRKFLSAARDNLDWRNDIVDRTLMALILVYLHGKRESSLSNQLRQAKAMAPDYAVRWWKSRNLNPPDIDPVEFLLQRIRWRYAKGRPSMVGSKIYLGDCTKILPQIERQVRDGRLPRPCLLLTSPPYFGITNYFYDQWLRLWMLGGPPNARRQPQYGKYSAKFDNITEYTGLLLNTFAFAKELLNRDAVVYIRTDRRRDTFDATLAALKCVFPKKHLSIITRRFHRPTQTRLFGDTWRKAGEVDIVLRQSRVGCAR